MRTPAVLAATALVASTLVAGLVGGQTAANAATVGIGYCSPSSGTPCITSATRNGTEPLIGPTEFAVTGTYVTPEPGDDDQSRYVHLNILSNTSEDPTDLGSAARSDTFSVTVDLGNKIVPRVATGKARDVTVTRTDNGDGTYAITVEGRPVRLDGQCDGNFNCPEDGVGTADESQEWAAIWSADITDYASWEDAAQRNAMYGMNYFNNIAATSVPPEIEDDHLLIRMANRHFREDGTTPVQGRAELRIPNAFLKEVYGIPDPGTMDGSSLVATGTATGPGTVTIAQESGKDAMKVLVDGITFSMRALRVKTGTITPTRPTQVSAMRLGERRGHLDSDPSNPRGATVTGYVGRCAAVRGDHVVTAVGEDTIVRVTGLRAGVAYDCRMRATSKAGPSNWSEAVRMGRRVIDPS
jgi:hypothetical protein